MRMIQCNKHTNLVRLGATFLRFASIFLVFIGLGLNASQASSQKVGGGNCFAGTYLFETASNSLSMWTFTKDGNVLVTSSVQKTLNFSDIQGVWKVMGPDKISASLLDFSFNESGEPINVARLDVVLWKSDKSCDGLVGEFTLRFFQDGEDPLDISTDAGEPIHDTLEGRRLTVIE